MTQEGPDTVDQEGAASATPQSAAKNPVKAKPALRTGQRVVLHNLEKASELNGHRGVVVKWKEDVGRYAVRVAGKEIAIKPDNLKPEGGAAEAAKFAAKHKNTEGVLYNHPAVYARTPGAGPKMTQWVGQVKAGQRHIVRAEKGVGVEAEPIPLWYGDAGFIGTSPVDVAVLINDVGADPGEWPHALGRVLDRFPVAAGRLRSVRRGQDLVWQIILNNAGVPFTTASVPPCSLPQGDELQQLCMDDQCGFFDLGALDGSETGPDEPLLRFKLISEEGTARGILGISFNHALCDISGIGTLLRWLHSELDSREAAPSVPPCFARSLADEVINALPEASSDEETAHIRHWPLWPVALERWCFLARRIRSGLRGRPDGTVSIFFSVPTETLAELRSEAKADDTPDVSVFEALVCYLGMKLLRLGRRGQRVLITKDYRAALEAAAPGNSLDSLFANVVTHGLSFQLPNVNDAIEMPLAEACAAMRSAIDGATLGYIGWHRKQNHYRGLPNFFSGLCCNSWGRALADVGFIETYAIGMRSVDERAANMGFPLDTAYMQVLPQPSGSQLVIMTMPLADMTAFMKELPGSHFLIPHVSQIRSHAFKVPLPSKIVESLSPTADCMHRYVRIACIGDSMTACGYPKYLQAMFDAAGIRTEVRNFGVAGTTALRFADHPYCDEKKLEDARLWRPHIVVATFGSNDSKDGNWDSDAFEADYTDLCVGFLERTSPKPKVYLVTPPPLYVADACDMQQDVVNNELPVMIPRVASSAERKFNAPLEAEAAKYRVTLPEEALACTGVVDAFSVLGGAELRKANCFAEDGVHPNERGTKLLACVVLAELRREVERSHKKWRDAPKVVNNEGMF